MSASLLADLLASLPFLAESAATQVHLLRSSFGWLGDLFARDSVAHAVLIISCVAALGMALGQVKVFNISLGIAGVLFAGLAFAHFGMTINHEVMEFVREFGLILFVYTIGLQVGPGFIGSLRKAGLRLNLMAAAVVVLGVITMLTIVKISERAANPAHRISIPAGVGLLSGAVTNTPSLAAAQEAIKEVRKAKTAATAPQPAAHSDPIAKLPGQGYAIAYPFGIMGIILTMLAVRAFFKINVSRENELFASTVGKSAALVGLNLEVSNPNIDNLKISEIPSLGEPGVVVSRILRAGSGSNQAAIAQPDTQVRKGDILHVVGPRERLEILKRIVGSESRIDVQAVSANIQSRRVVVTKSSAIGKTADELGIGEKYDVRITRASRAEVEIPFPPSWRFQFADVLLVVGDEASIKAVASALGDSVRKLESPHIIPVFVGIALGVILGSWPVFLPNMPYPVKLGLAGGPLLVAILLARVGQIGKLTWYMPRSANFTLREFGIVLFLACVGLRAGDGFINTLIDGPGFYWMAMASIITLLPLMTVGLVARAFLKMNYVTICGVLAGSMTDPPALAFANTIVGQETPSVAYATVYPLTMILRVVFGQTLVLLFMT